LISRPIDELSLGDAEEITRVVTLSDVTGFVETVGDRNPVHSDPVFAASTPFGEVIAPGIWTAGLISAVIGTQLPGPGSIYISQSLKFLAPVKLGDTITARVEIAEILQERKRIRLNTVCVNQRGENVLTGEAWVRPPKCHDVYVEPTSGMGDFAFWALQPSAWASQTLTAWTKIGELVLEAAAASLGKLSGPSSTLKTPAKVGGVLRA
jgi:3-hydroxybutyryl-CoA dehydratase